MRADPPDLAELERVRASAHCLHDAKAIAVALDRVAAQLQTRLDGTNPLMLCVMTGGFMVASELARRLQIAMEFDYLQVSRYGRATQGGELAWRVRPRIPLAGRTVLVVDDILDQGHTLREILHWCRAAGAGEVLSLVLVDKRHGRKCEKDFRADYSLLETDDHYLFGFGMDYRGYLRNADGIYAVGEEFL